MIRCNGPGASPGLVICCFKKSIRISELLSCWLYCNLSIHISNYCDKAGQLRPLAPTLWLGMRGVSDGKIQLHPPLQNTGNGLEEPLYSKTCVSGSVR